MSGNRRRARLRGARATLHGRDRELDLLVELLDDAVAGHGSLAIVSGEAGIGKTSLVNALVEVAGQRGCLTLRGHCYDLTTTPPFGPWIEFLAAARRAMLDLPPLPEALSGESASGSILEQRALHSAVTAFLQVAAERRPLVIVVEDLHWADPASIELLRHVARAVSDTRVLITTTHRDDEPAPPGPLHGGVLLSLIRETDADRIELRRLRREAVSTLIREHYGLSAFDESRLVAHVQRLADGNPLFALELLRTLEHERMLQQHDDGWTLGALRETRTPLLVAGVIGRRLERLDTGTRAALEVAAVIGHMVTVATWQALSGLTPDDFERVVEQALDGHVLQEGSDPAALTFTHALTRLAIYERIVPTRRGAMHRATAETLVATTRADPDDVARHFQQAGDERALEWLVRAGLRAWKAAAWVSAAERFVAAAALLEGDAARASAQGWLLYLAGTLLRYTDNPRMQGLLEQAEQVGWRAGDDVLRATCAWHIGIAHCHRGEMRSGLARIEQGVDALDRLGREAVVLPDESQALAAILTLVPEQQRAPGAVPELDWRKAGLDGPFLFQAGPLINWLSQSGRLLESVALGEQWVAALKTIDGARVYPREMTGVSGRYGLSRSYALLGRVEEARTNYRLAREAAALTGDYALENYCAVDEFQCLTLRYDAADLTRRAHLLLDTRANTTRAEGQIAGIRLDMLGRAAIDLIEGRWDDIGQPDLEAQEAVVAKQVYDFHMMLGTLARNRGEWAQAWSHVNALFPAGPSTAPGDCVFMPFIAAQQLAVSLALDTGELDTARNWLEANVCWLDWTAAFADRAEARTLWARYYEQSGDSAAARGNAEQAVALASNPRQPFAAIAAHRVLGRMARLQGDVETAATVLAAARVEAEACAAPFERALTLLELAELHAARAELDEALAAVRTAREICEPLRAAPALAWADDIEGRLALAGPRTAHASGLSTREVEVLRLLAAGQNNRQIADELFVSPRTVERHVANIYLKIDAHTRAEAAQFALRNHLA